jgi:hypothetical protein
VITERAFARDVTADDIRILLVDKQKELDGLEFKVAADADLLKAACAIANADGGFIIIGVAEDEENRAHHIVNVEGPKRQSDSVRQRLRDGLSPRPVIEVESLEVDADTVIVIRIAPQNPPHMISVDKRSDFYGRYDATSERMRYEEIEQRFRDKFTQGQLQQSSVPADRTVIETLGGRRSVAESTVDALLRHLALFEKGDTPTLGLIAIQENTATPMTEQSARRLFSYPSYKRDGGWAVIHPSLPMKPVGGGGWQQDYGEFSRTFVNASSDIMFQKPIDSVFCWRQNEHDFERQPRLYSNALIEYCLSFAYAFADVAALTDPASSLVQAIFMVDKAKGVRLPLGEGGTVWFDSPARKPNEVHDKKTSVPLPVPGGAPIHARRLAFAIAAQIYAMFGYSEAEVPFSNSGVVTFGAREDQAGVSAIRSYLRSIFGFDVEVSSLDFNRDVYWFRIFDDDPKRFKIAGFTEDFVDEFGADEDGLFAQLGGVDIAGLLERSTSRNRLIFTTTGPQLVDAS